MPPFPQICSNPCGHTHKTGGRWRNNRKVSAMRRGIPNHRIKSKGRVQSGSSKERPSPKSDQAARDHSQLTSEYPHGQIFHSIMQELKLLTWDMDQGWKVTTQLNDFCYFAPLHCFPFTPSAELGSSQYHFSWHLSLLHGHITSLLPAVALVASLLSTDARSLNLAAWELQH